MFNVECPRCLGEGRFDRGTCFECKGARSVKRKTRPVGAPLSFVIMFANGSENRVQMFFRSAANASKAIEYQIAKNKWLATIWRDIPPR